MEKLVAYWAQEISAINWSRIFRFPICHINRNETDGAYKRNATVPSRKHCCSGEEISIVYSVCVCVCMCVCSLSYPTCKVHAPYYSVIFGVMLVPIRICKSLVINNWASWSDNPYNWNNFVIRNANVLMKVLPVAVFDPFWFMVGKCHTEEFIRI